VGFALRRGPDAVGERANLGVGGAHRGQRAVELEDVVEVAAARAVRAADDVGGDVERLGIDVVGVGRRGEVDEAGDVSTIGPTRSSGGQADVDDEAA